MEPEDQDTPTPAPPPVVLCPHCKTPLGSVGWLHNAEIGLVTFYHNEPDCMTVISVQVMPVEQKRIHAPAEYGQFRRSAW
jgi:hypothetical protein